MHVAPALYSITRKQVRSELILSRFPAIVYTDHAFLSVAYESYLPEDTIHLEASTTNNDAVVLAAVTFTSRAIRRRVYQCKEGASLHSIARLLTEPDKTREGTRP